MPRLPAVVLVSCLLAAEAHAALPDGTKAPLFTAQASLVGKAFTFSLADALKKGPVVLHFYPAAFTLGCTEEAHCFARPRAHPGPRWLLLNIVSAQYTHVFRNYSA